MRPWRDIAREMVNLTDDERLRVLRQELNRALAEQGMDGIPITLPKKPLNRSPIISDRTDSTTGRK